MVLAIASNSLLLYDECSRFVQLWCSGVIACGWSSATACVHWCNILCWATCDTINTVKLRYPKSTPWAPWEFCSAMAVRHRQCTFCHRVNLALFSNACASLTCAVSQCADQILHGVLNLSGLSTAFLMLLISLAGCEQHVIADKFVSTSVHVQLDKLQVFSHSYFGVDPLSNIDLAAEHRSNPNHTWYCFCHGFAIIVNDCSPQSIHLALGLTHTCIRWVPLPRSGKWPDSWYLTPLHPMHFVVPHCQIEANGRTIFAWLGKPTWCVGNSELL